jgi:hypothetical protein
MVSFTMIMAYVGMDRPAQHVLAKEDHPFQTLLAKPSPKSFQMSVQIGRPRGQANGFDAGIALTRLW